MNFDVWWISFGVLILALLVLDIGVFNRRAHEIRLKEALLWSAFWIILALIFNIVVYFLKGQASAVQFFTAYLVEKSLSMDNLFVFLMIFTFFQVPHKYQHKVLFWGILGALVLRFVFILAGIALITKFHWTMYVFGAILVYSGFKMIKEKDKEIHPEKNPVIKLFRKIMPVTKTFFEGKFFVKQEARWHATPLFIVLLIIETSDVVFAVDSIPAVLAISQDSFIVFTSNIMAILGLRALYFALAGVMKIFRYLHYGLAIILIFVGLKMSFAEFYKISIYVSLLVIFLVLSASIIASMLASQKNPQIDVQEL